MPDMAVPPHLHVSWLHSLLTLLEILLVWIPIKIVAALYAGKNGLADATLNVL
jgi:hypothetical protein